VTLNLHPNDKKKFLAAVKQHGQDAVLLAWKAFVKTGSYNAETKYPAYLFFKDGNSENYIADALRKMQSHEWQIEHDPAYAERFEESIKRQAAANWERLITPGPSRENGANVEEYIADFEKDKV